MKEEQTIEKYLNGNLSGLKLKLFEISLKNNKNLQKKVNIYKDIDKFIKIPIMVADAELEMREKNIDKLAFGFVSDWLSSFKDENKIAEFINISMS